MRCLVSLANSRTDPATGRDFVAGLQRPFADIGRVGSAIRLSLGGGTPAATNAAGVLSPLAQSIAHRLSILVREINLVPRAVKGKGNGLGRLGAVSVIFKNCHHALCHMSDAIAQLCKPVKSTWQS